MRQLNADPDPKHWAQQVVFLSSAGPPGSVQPQMTLEELKIRKLQFPREAYARQLKNT
jgi:hypothetical protein